MSMRWSFAAALLFFFGTARSFSPSINFRHDTRTAGQIFVPLRANGPCSSLSGSACSTELVVNGESMNNTILPSDENLPSSPPLSFQKFVTMQDKRVVVTVTYSGLSGLRPFFLTFAKKIKAQNPDVIIEQRILPPVEQNGEPVFEILVDGKLVIGKGQSKKQGVRRSSSSVSQEDLAGGLSVFVSVEDVTTAITKARKRRRPSTAYSSEEDGSGRSKSSAVRLEMLRKSRERQHGEGPWTD